MKSKKEIAVDIDRSDSRAASTFVHEGIHGFQVKREKDERIYIPISEKEYEAHIEQEKFNIRNGIPPKDPSFRIKDKDGKFVVNIEAIKKWVNRGYGVGRYYENYNYDIKNKKGPITGWDCSKYPMPKSSKKK